MHERGKQPTTYPTRSGDSLPRHWPRYAFRREPLRHARDALIAAVVVTSAALFAAFRFWSDQVEHSHPDLTFPQWLRDTIAHELDGRHTFNEDSYMVIGVGCVLAWLVAVIVTELLRAAANAVRRGWRALDANTHPREPWRREHPWQDDGTKADGRAREIMAGAMSSVWSASVLALLIYSSAYDRGIVGIIAVCVAGPMVAMSLFAFLEPAIGQAVRGRDFLRFGTYPFEPGDPIHVYYEPSRALYGCLSVTFTLRCVKAGVTLFGDEIELALPQVCFEHYCDVKVERTVDSIHPGAGLGIPFRLPDDADLVTVLDADHPCWWELSVDVVKRDGGHTATFLLPVYAQAEVDYG